jgi:plasmid stabilization system protein ParE
MSLLLEFLPEAQDDAEQAVRYYEERVPGLGALFRMELESACAAIVRQLLLWRERSGGFRRVNLPGFPFYIAFFLRHERV